MTEPADSRVGDVPLKAEREGVATLPQKPGKEKFTDKLSQLKSLVSAERAAAVAPVCVSVGAAKAASLPCLHASAGLSCRYTRHTCRIAHARASSVRHICGPALRAREG